MRQHKPLIYLINFMVALVVSLMADAAHAQGRHRPVKLAMNPASSMTAVEDSAFQGPMFIGQFRTRSGCERIRNMPTRPEESFSWCTCNGAAGGKIELVCGFGPG